MLVRFSIRKTPDGRELSRKALVYTLEEHGIARSRIDPDAVRLIQRLRAAGHQGYVVGGAVRDLLVGIVPKDFDIATDAHPGAIRKLFRSSRVIGRRFKLVHVYFGREKYLEVATFRAGPQEQSPEEARPAARDARRSTDTYGSMAEDAVRRDFTLNALFYCPIKEQVVDHVGGVKDIRARRMRSITADDVSFQEDPVRMIRAVKHAALVGFRLPNRMRRAMRAHRDRLGACSPQRLTEELYKVLRCGSSRLVIHNAYRLGILSVILPALHRSLLTSRVRVRALEQRLQVIDGQVKHGGTETSNGALLAALLGDCAPLGASARDVIEALRAASVPLIPSNNDLRVASACLGSPLPPRATPTGRATRRRRPRRAAGQAGGRRNG
jgi:poly(A) polymerase